MKNFFSFVVACLVACTTAMAQRVVETNTVYNKENLAEYTKYFLENSADTLVFQPVENQDTILIPRLFLDGNKLVNQPIKIVKTQANAEELKRLRAMYIDTNVEYHAKTNNAAYDHKYAYSAELDTMLQKEGNFPNSGSIEVVRLKRYGFSVSGGAGVSVTDGSFVSPEFVLGAGWDARYFGFDAKLGLGYTKESKLSQTPGEKYLRYNVEGMVTGYPLVLGRYEQNRIGLFAGAGVENTRTDSRPFYTEDGQEGLIRSYGAYCYWLAGIRYEYHLFAKPLSIGFNVYYRNTRAFVVNDGARHYGTIGAEVTVKWLLKRNTAHNAKNLF